MNVGEYLRRLTKYLVTMFCFVDIMNMPFMDIFDTVYPLNGSFWVICLLVTEVYLTDFTKKE